MSAMENLEDVLLDELKDIYSAESQLLKAIPKLEKKASDERLKKALAAHFEETQGQMERLDKIAEILGTKLVGKKCKAMQGLIEEGEEILAEKSGNKSLIDLLLIGAAQRVEHYEIAAYGVARAIAEQLGHSEVVDLLDESLNEESNADDLLTEIAQEEILPAAAD